MLLAKYWGDRWESFDRSVMHLTTFLNDSAKETGQWGSGEWSLEYDYTEHEPG